MKITKLILLLCFVVLLAGCGELQKLITQATAQTISINQDLLNQTTQAGASAADIIRGQTFGPGQSQLGAVSVKDLADAIDVVRDDMGPTRFFLALSITNRGGAPTSVSIALYPSGQASAAVEIVSFNLGGGQTVGFDTGQMLDQNTEAIHERIKAVFDLVDESFAVTPVVTVRGGSGVNINQFRIWAPPTSLQTNELSDQSLSGKVKIDRIYDTQLLGSLTNEGAASTVVRIYLNNDDATDIQAGLVAEGVIDPGQTIQGADLEVDGAQDRAASELENYLGGDHVHYDIVMVSLMPIKVQADNLQLHAKVDVHAQIF